MARSEVSHKVACDALGSTYRYISIVLAKEVRLLLSVFQRFTWW